MYEATTIDGPRLRILDIIDDFTAELLCLMADNSLSGKRVVHKLDVVIVNCTRPSIFVSGNVHQ